MKAIPAPHNPTFSTGDIAGHESRYLMQSSALLGAGKLFKHAFSSRLEVHAAILEGVFQYRSLLFLQDSCRSLDESDFVKVMGISTRTLRRQKEYPAKPLPPDLASRMWLFAGALAKAAEVFGSKDRSEEWMTQPAMGLDGQRPIDMLRTLQAADLVSGFLTRLEYNVHS